MRALLALPLMAAVAGCPRASEPPEQRHFPAAAPPGAAAARPAPASSTPGKPTAVDWRALMGTCVVVEGHLVDSHKLGPALIHPQFTIGLVPSEDRPSSELVGRQVRVEGVVAERADLPVFIQKKGELPRQGMPVPEGTDLAEARKRFVIEGAAITGLRSAQEVQAALSAQLGKEVTLPGILWSLNGHWWFAHDGVDLHLDGLERLPGFGTELHGRAVALHGRLERKLLPRIDQIALGPKRELAEAYLLTELSMKPHPAPPPRPCAR